MPEPTPDPVLTARIRSREFDGNYRRYLAYVSRRLRRVDAAGDTGIEAESIVSQATLACLEGARTWPPELDFHRFFRRVLRSLLAHALEHRRADRRRREGSPEPDEVAAPSDRAGEIRDARRKVEAVMGAASGDPGIEEMLGALADGAEKPSDVEEMLGWSPAQTKAVRMRLGRKLAKAGILEQSREKAATRPGPKKVCA
jgi:DNA-directed RNA polymerase specialized sigma24 family protein